VLLSPRGLAVNIACDAKHVQLPFRRMIQGVRRHGRISAGRTAIAALLLLMGAAAILLAMGRPAICICGRIELWHSAIDAGNSQHIADWYSPSHLIHGLLFYAAGWLMLRRWPLSFRLLVAIAIEAAWEILENSPMVIDRYRTATMALGYEGDSVLNSLCDIGFMTLGFWLARRLPIVASIGMAIALELLALAVIRDNLTLNVLMLAWPIDAIRIWQAGAG